MSFKIELPSESSCVNCRQHSKFGDLSWCLEHDSEVEVHDGCEHFDPTWKARHDK